MIRARITAALLMISFHVSAETPLHQAVFSWVRYSGHDPVADAMPRKPGQYRNPVLPGFQPDPSIVRVGKEYYLITSSFAFYPGLPLYHSRDLVNWQQIGNAIDRPDMFDVSGLGVARAVFAPTLRYHAGLFYIVNTCIECGFNFIISAKNPAGPWSKPVFLSAVDGIDPDLFFDTDGRAWISNNGPPVGTPQYDGHRAIWLQEVDLKTQNMIGPRRVLVNGGVKFADKPIWTEGPHLFKKAGWYYLIAAEGGTAGNHSETVFRSRHVTGPYVPGPNNPILTQRDLDPARPYPVYATGHADFVQLPSGQWWCVFLGTRPYEANLSNIGRETFLLPVTWRNGWPNILPAKTVVPQIVTRPALPAERTMDRDHWRDNFTDARLAPDWLMLRTPKETWYRLSAHPGALALTARDVSLSSTGNPSFLAKRQRHTDAVVETEMRYRPAHDGDHAGLAAFADEHHHFFLGLWQTSKGPELVVTMRHGKDEPDEGEFIAAIPYTENPNAPIRLRISIHGAACDFAYAIDQATWHSLLTNVDAKMLASERSNQFTGVVLGVYAKSHSE